MYRHRLFVTISAGLLLGACACPFAKDNLADDFTGNTLVGKDYATYFVSDSEAVMDWQGKRTKREWWVDKGQFCHKTDDGSVCEQVRQLSDNSYEFCGRWGCFPAELQQGNTKGF